MAIEARSIDWVPETERHGRIWHQAPLWFLGNFQYFTIPIGFIGPSLGLSMWWTILAGTLGILVGTVFMAFHAAQGPTLGLPQMIQSRAQFGYRGVIVPLFATLFTYLAFNVVDQILLADGLEGAFGWNGQLVAIVCAVGAAALAIFGHDYVHRIFRILLYISLPLMLVLTVGVIFGAAGGGAEDKGSFTWIAFMAQFSAAAAYNITYAPYVSDYSRYLPRETTNRSIIASVFFGASGSAIWLIALGAWLAVSLGATDGLVGLQTAGNNIFSPLGDLAAFFSAAALAATMGMNAYGGMLTVLTGIDSVKPIKPQRVHRVVTILVLAVGWFVIAEAISAGAVATLFTALTLMLYLLVPWTATNLVDFFFVRRGHYAITELFNPNGIYGKWGARGLIAYAVGFAFEIPFMVLLEWEYTGPLAPNGIDIAWIVGLVVSGSLYWFLCRTLDVERERKAEATSDRELVRGDGVNGTVKIGARLRHAREGARLSLADVEQRTGVSKGFLSKVERDAASPSVANLVAICDAIGLQMSELFAVPRTTLIRHADRPSLDGLPKAKAVRDTLITPEHERHVTVLETLVTDGGSGGDELYTMPSECEVCYVLEGDIEVELEDGTYALGPGDALTFGAAVPHTWRTDTTARILWILAPGLPDPRKEVT